MTKGKRQVASNPFLKPDLHYACAVSDCPNIGIWSPQSIVPPNAGVGTWYCRQHAGLREPDARWSPSSGPYTPEQIAEAKRKVKAFIASGKDLLVPASDDWWHKLVMRWRAGERLLMVQQEMVTRAWINAHRPAQWAPPMEPDAEWIAEREAMLRQEEPV